MNVRTQNREQRTENREHRTENKEQTKYSVFKHKTRQLSEEVGFIRNGFFLWLLLALVILYDNSAYAINRHFHYIDFTLIAGVMLLIGGRDYTAFMFTVIAALIHDALLMPFAGFSLTSKITALLAGRILCLSLYRDNYPTKIVILACVEVIKEITGVIIVFFFYASMTKVVFPFFIILWKIATTIAAGAIIMKIAELNYKRIGSWLKTMSPIR